MLQIKNDFKEKINPSGEVPTLVHDNKLIFESDIIAEYLDLISG
jgi:glutathione S-transferase